MDWLAGVVGAAVDGGRSALEAGLRVVEAQWDALEADLVAVHPDGPGTAASVAESSDLRRADDGDPVGDSGRAPAAAPAPARAAPALTTLAPGPVREPRLTSRAQETV
jgi:hypothetical protein